MEIVAQPEQSASSGKGIAASTLSEQGQEATSERILPATLSGPKLLSRQAGRDSAHSGHAPDYGWLVGELHYVHVRDVWCLRYAAPEEDDRYGGRVTLVDTGAMTAYRNGQMVRVEGRLCDPDSREPSPAYRVQAIRPLP